MKPAFASHIPEPHLGVFLRRAAKNSSGHNVTCQLLNEVVPRIADLVGYLPPLEVGLGANLIPQSVREDHRPCFFWELPAFSEVDGQQVPLATLQEDVCPTEKRLLRTEIGDEVGDGV